MSSLTEVKGPDEEHVNTVHRSYVLDYAKSLLCLDLNHGQQRFVGLLEVLRHCRDWVESLHRKRRPKAPLAFRGELGRGNNLMGLLDSSKQWDQDLWCPS
jgi:hypothetical protein